MSRRLMNRVPGRGLWFTLVLLPFVALALVYASCSAQRHADNPEDRILPTLSQMAQAVDEAALQPDRRTGEYLLWHDTAASLARLAGGAVISVALGLGVGLAIGLLPLARAGLGPLVAAAATIPPMAVLPILLIVLGLGEVSKIALIVLGIAPFLMRDLSLTVQALPREQLVKAQTLGASTWQTLLRVVLPQIMPRLLECLRLSIGPAFLFLISAEAISAESGLGYRIFLVRRYLAMDLILPYVAWIALLSWLLDRALARLSRSCFPWAHAAAG